ncbi:hypothetical protein ACOMHN_015357 [Nucella lapillus]
MVKYVVFALALVCVAYVGPAGLLTLVRHEVHQLLAADPALTVASCTDKCDNLFALVVVDDETATDQFCAHECTRSKDLTLAMMKYVVVALVLVCVAYAATHLNLHILVRHEVHQLLAADPAMTVADCTDKCDNLFALVGADDETLTDQYCSQECTR